MALRKSFLITCLSFLVVSCGQPAGDDEIELPDGISSTQHRIFVTSVDYDGNLGGLSGADSKCQELAEAAGLEKTYKALLSSSSVDAKDHLALTGSIVAIDSDDSQIVIASTTENFWSVTSSNNLVAKINVDENGQVRTGQTPWTGSSSSGEGSLNFCSDWASNDSVNEGDFGSTDSLDATWVENNFEDCNNLNPLFCVSVD